jgi:hypothetical protein
MDEILHAASCAADTLFKFLAFTTTVFMEFLKVFDALSGGTKLRFLSFLSLEKREC